MLLYLFICRWVHAPISRSNDDGPCAAGEVVQRGADVGHAHHPPEDTGERQVQDKLQDHWTRHPGQTAANCPPTCKSDTEQSCSSSSSSGCSTIIDASSSFSIHHDESNIVPTSNDDTSINISTSNDDESYSNSKTNDDDSCNS